MTSGLQTDTYKFMEDERIVTWKNAVAAWGRQPQNKIHWPKIKDTFQKVFQTLDPVLTCAECTLEVLATAMSDIIAERDDQKRCAAFMIQSLNYAAATYPADNPMPKFTSFELINRANEIQQELYLSGNSAATEVAPSEEPHEEAANKTEQEEVANKPEQEWEEAANKPPRNTKTRTVVQLSPDPLQPIAVFGSISEAEKATGIRNIYRAVANYSMAGGFFWCMAGDEEAVAQKAVIPRGGRPSAKKPKKEDPREHQAPVIPPEPFLISDEDLIDELRRRGYTGELNITKTIIL